MRVSGLTRDEMKDIVSRSQLVGVVLNGGRNRNNAWNVKRVVLRVSGMRRIFNWNVRRIFLISA